jgi:hypothetical protein
VKVEGGGISDSPVVVETAQVCDAVSEPDILIRIFWDEISREVRDAGHADTYSSGALPLTRFHLYAGTHAHVAQPRPRPSAHSESLIPSHFHLANTTKKAAYVYSYYFADFTGWWLDIVDIGV